MSANADSGVSSEKRQQRSFGPEGSYSALRTIVGSTREALGEFIKVQSPSPSTQRG